MRHFSRRRPSAGLHGLKGHRVLGGMRASIYNAMPLAGVETLIAFMREFERRHAMRCAHGKPQNAKPAANASRETGRRAEPRSGSRRRRGAPPAGVGLANIRDSIDAIDARIHALLNERARFAQLVGISKSASGKAVDFYRPEREAEVLRMALKRNQGPLRDEEIARLFREIMSACLAQQEPLKVAFLGPEGTFTQAAVLKHFGSSVRALPLPAIDEVFHEVEGGIADFGVVPIENSSEGTVNHTLDMFLTSALKICGEVELRINHSLDGKDERYRGRQARVRASPGAGAMPRLAGRSTSGRGARGAYPAMPRARAARATSAAPRRSPAARPPRSTGSTCSPMKSRTGRTTPRVFWSWAENYSARAAPIAPRCWCRPADTDDAGALFRLLEPLAQHRVNMTRIESRPSRKRKWDYVFFIDIEGHVSDPRSRKALAALEKRASLFKVLGSYPRAVL